MNAEERYFTLFQTLMTADWSVIESNASSSSSSYLGLPGAANNWCRRLTPGKEKGGIPASQAFFHWSDQALAALLELFGMLEIPRVAPEKGENRLVTTVLKTKFGDAFLTCLYDLVMNRLPDFLDPIASGADESKWLGALYNPYFPNCRKTLGEQEGEFIEGVWQFKVSLGEVWRRIVIPADRNVEELIDGILQGFNFDADHLYSLRGRDCSGRRLEIGHPSLNDASYFADEFAVGTLPLEPGQPMTLLYDFGDDWEFNVKLEKILPESAAKKLKILERNGTPPRQYEW